MHHIRVWLFLQYKGKTFTPNFNIPFFRPQNFHLSIKASASSIKSIRSCYFQSKTQKCVISVHRSWKISRKKRHSQNKNTEKQGKCEALYTRYTLGTRGVYIRRRTRVEPRCLANQLGRSTYVHRLERQSSLQCVSRRHTRKSVKFVLSDRARIYLSRGESRVYTYTYTRSIRPVSPRADSAAPL